MTESEMRERFENVIFARYFLSTIQRNPNPPKGTGALDFISVGCKTKSEFLKRKDDGHYEEPTVDVAWWAWQKAIEDYCELLDR